MMQELIKNYAWLAFLAPLIAFWSQFKSLFSYIVSFVIRKDEIEGHYLIQDFLLPYLHENSIVVKFGNKKFQNERGLWIPKYAILTSLYLKVHKNIFFLYKRWMPLLVSGSPDLDKITITYIPFIGNFDSIVEKCVKDMNNKDINSYKELNARNFYLQTVINERGQMLLQMATASKSNEEKREDKFNSSSNTATALTSYYLFNKSAKYHNHINLTYEDVRCPEKEVFKSDPYWWSEESKKLIDSIELWDKNRKWYDDRNIPWHRGAILHGLAGCGKTTLIRKTAMKLHLPLICLKLSTFDDEFMERLSPTSREGVIFLIEDIDVTFHQRTNVTKSSNYFNPLSFDSLLNKISGVNSAYGVYWIATTNHIDKVDSALLRAGRLDTKIEVKPLEEDGKRYIANRILIEPALVEKAVKEFSPVAVEFENSCMELAMQEFGALK